MDGIPRVKFVKIGESSGVLTPGKIKSAFMDMKIDKTTYYMIISYLKEIEQKEYCMNHTTPDLCECKALLFRVLSMFPQEMLDEFDPMKSF
jgi:hypothetical protein